MKINFKFQISNFKLWYRFAIIFVLAVLFGAGCKNNGDLVLEEGKIRDALMAVSNELGWADGIMNLPPGADNSYGESLAAYGPYQEKVGELDTRRNSVEAIKFETPAYAARVYDEDDCLKGRGVPFEVAGVTACCLNDKEKETSRAIMQKENYIFRGLDYFHADCRAAEYLKSFWKEYLKK